MKPLSLQIHFEPRKKAFFDELNCIIQNIVFQIASKCITHPVQVSELNVLLSQHKPVLFNFFIIVVEPLLYF